MWLLFDPLYLMVMLPAILLAAWAQIKVKSAYARYTKMANSNGYSGADAARALLDAEGVYDVDVTETQGWLSDHYDPTRRVLRLSPEVYRGRSVAAVSIAAHEAGHAMQHAMGYAPLALRNLIVPAASIGSSMAWILIAVGFLLRSMQLGQLGVIVFSAVVIFQIVNLPVEFNASTRARAALTTHGIIRTVEESAGVRKVLWAAAMTYVAATITALIQLLYFALRFGMLGGGDD